MGPVFAAVAREALAVLAEDPREPRILNYAGIAFYEVGELAAAEELFKAARRLDPDLPHVDTQPRRDRAPPPRGPVEPAGSRRRCGSSLKDLAPRARKIAARAQPAEGMTLSLCMIVKDEEAMLGRTPRGRPRLRRRDRRRRHGLDRQHRRDRRVVRREGPAPRVDRRLQRRPQRVARRRDRRLDHLPRRRRGPRRRRRPAPARACSARRGARRTTSS